MRETGLQLQLRVRHFIIQGSPQYGPFVPFTVTVVISLSENGKRIETNWYFIHEKRNNQTGGSNEIVMIRQCQ